MTTKHPMCPPPVAGISRRATLAGVAAAAAAGAALPSAIPGAAALATAPIPPADPILAVIENYKQTVAARSIALDATWDGGNPAFKGLPKDAPACLAADDVHGDALEAEWEAFDLLFTMSPTTIGGVVALLDLLVTDPYFDPERPDLLGETVLEWALGRWGVQDFISDFMTDLASTLRSLAVDAGQGGAS
jgi:hypothetical protein